MSTADLSRRAVLAAAPALVGWPGLVMAAAPPGGRLAFVAYRNGSVVGEHHMIFSGDAGSPSVVTEVEMVVKLGPVPVYRYRHTAEERWSDGRFQSLQTRTDANGRSRSVIARRTSAGVLIDTAGKRIAAPADAAPLTHWNAAVFTEQMFNPQEGDLLRLVARRIGRTTIQDSAGAPLRATQWSLRGEAEIDDFYDAAGTWAGLRGRLTDGSTMTYRRKA